MTLKPHFFPPQTLASLHSSSDLTEIFMLSEKLTWFVKKFTFLQSILTFESASMTNMLTCLQTRFHATWQVTAGPTDTLRRIWALLGHWCVWLARWCGAPQPGCQGV